MRKYFLHILFLPALGLLHLLPEVIQAQPQSPYQQGLEQLYRGDTEGALNYWEEYYEENSRVDSRVGFEYIQVVTSENLNHRHGSATNMYYRALLDGTGVNSRIAIRQEIERMKPLTGDGIYRQWVKWWDKEDDAHLHRDMRGFWVQLDPTPALEVNERLIEHWNRIADARSRFTKNRSSIYGTDDRALIYVRYGEPNRIRRGILTLQDLNIKPWLERQIIFRQPEREDRDMQHREERVETQQVHALENIIYDFHRYPEYEIWFYDELSPSDGDPVPFIFGTNPDTDNFELHRSVDGFIPERAYNPDEMRRHLDPEFVRAGLTPALMLQMLYYEQLSSFDSFFNSRLNNLRETVLEQGPEAFQGLDLTFRTRTIEMANNRTAQLPRQVSSNQKHLPKIPVNVYQYRFLDENLNPYLITYVESSPQEAFKGDFSRNRPDGFSVEEIDPEENVTELLPDYQLVHNIQKYSSDWNLKSSESEEPPLFLRQNSSDRTSSSAWQFEHNGRDEQSASVMLYNNNPESQQIYDSPYPKELRGLGSIYFRQPAPLVSHPDSLQLADLVLGYQMLEESDMPFSFIVANDQAVPADESLVLHFEVYNLEMQSNGFSNFELTYRIFPVDKEGNVLTDQTEFVLTLNFTSEEPQLIEDLEIETADLHPGLYELRVAVTDSNTRQEKRRATRFEVVE